MTVCRLCRERPAARTFVLTAPGGSGGTVTHLCNPCARALIPEEDWSTFGLEPDPAQTATIDLNGPPRYTRGMADGTSASNLDWRRSP